MNPCFLFHLVFLCRPSPCLGTVCKYMLECTFTSLLNPANTTMTGKVQCQLAMPHIISFCLFAAGSGWNFSFLLSPGDTVGRQKQFFLLYVAGRGWRYLKKWLSVLLGCPFPKEADFSWGYFSMYLLLDLGCRLFQHPIWDIWKAIRKPRDLTVMSFLKS